MGSSRFAVAFMLLAACAASGRAPERPPNIILIVADDLGPFDLGCTGQKRIKTPHVDRLAREGMRFTQFYCGAPVCAPSRCVLMTGKHLAHATVRTNYAVKPGKWDEYGGQLPIPAGSVTLANLLKGAGYATGAFGKWGLGGVGSTGDPLNQGFDRFFGYNCQGHAHNFYPRYLVDNDAQFMLEGNDRGLTGKHYAPQVIADQLLKFIRAKKDRPFFVYYPTIIPHLALQVPEEDLAAYKGKWPETPYTGNRYLPHPTPRACYAAMISFMDRQVGRILALLESLGLADDTVVLFSSDNGVTSLKAQVDYDFFGSKGPFRGVKGSVYEGGIRVPLVVRWPGKVRPGAGSDHVSAFYDFMPTFCDIAGIDTPKGTDGVSFLPTLLGQSKRQKDHEFLIWEFHGYGGQQAVRMGDWKAVRVNCFRKPDGPVELYNLAEDIGESKNLAEDRPELVKRLAGIMESEHAPSEIFDFRKGPPRRKRK